MARHSYVPEDEVLNVLQGHANHLQNKGASITAKWEVNPSPTILFVTTINTEIVDKEAFKVYPLVAFVVFILITLVSGQLVPQLLVDLIDKTRFRLPFLEGREVILVVGEARFIHTRLPVGDSISLAPLKEYSLYTQRYEEPLKRREVLLGIISVDLQLIRSSSACVVARTEQLHLEVDFGPDDNHVEYQFM